MLSVIACKDGLQGSGDSAAGVSVVCTGSVSADWTDWVSAACTGGLSVVCIPDGCGETVGDI